MPRADTANFNRFLTSLGLLLVAVSLFGPYFYFHNVDLLRIPRKELAMLNEESRKAILGRQSTLVDIEKPVIGLAILMFAGGCVCLGAGGWRLWRQQVKEDAAIDRQAQLDNFKINKQTEAEKRERLEIQAKEVADARGGEDRLDLRESRLAVGRTDERLNESLASATFNSYEFLSDVTVLGEEPGDQIAIDGLFNSDRADLPDVVFEQKLVVGDPIERLQHYVDPAVHQLGEYRRLTRKAAVIWLVLVLVNEGAELPRALRDDIQHHFDDAMGVLGRATLLTEDELASAPERFQALFVPDGSLSGSALA
jgi:hypothetical protein